VRRILVILQITATLYITGCNNRYQGPVVSGLTCENLIEPSGIDTDKPCLSWKIITPESGASQNAYQILAATSEEKLNEEACDLWNSGKIISDRSVLVPYEGKYLISRSVCYWKVRVWDDKDRVSEWSNSSFFSIGLLEKDDWDSDYIGMKDNLDLGISPQLRKTFELADAEGLILLHVNSLGYHEIYINGTKAGRNVLVPAVSQFDKRSLAVTYNVTPLVRKGKNDIIIWTGQGWYSEGLPGVIGNVPLVKAQLEQLKNGKWNMITGTDSSWTCRESGYYTTGDFRPGRFGGERVEGTILLRDLSSLSLNSVDWDPVFVTDKPAGEITPQMTESNLVTDTISTVSVKPLGEKEWLADLGTTLTGWAEIRFSNLAPGQEIKMEYSDHLDREGNVVNQGQTDFYIARGNGSELFCNKFNYHGFRYIKLSNLSEQPLASDIKGLLIHTGYKSASSFECSDTDLNSIHNMIKYTLQCLSLGGYIVDCPQIERLGYGGDGNASTETAQIMFNLAPLYSNWLQAWADCIREDGSMPHTAPNPYAAGGGPYWCGFIITASWRTYLNYGDRRILEKFYPVMQKWLRYADMYSPGGLLRKWPETDYRAWYLGDWASPEGVDQTNESSIDLVNNCFMAVCFDTMEKIAREIGRTSDAENYTKKKNEIRLLIQNEFYNNKLKKYGSGSQIDLTYPLLAGIVPDSLYDDVRDSLFNMVTLKHKGHVACGLVGVPVFTEWAVTNRETDFMYSMLKKREYPGYLYMLDNGATTTWEHWNGARSRIHNCYNGIGSWFYQAAGGILPDGYSPGYSHFIIEPQFPTGITWAKTTKETPFGTIVLYWTNDDKKIKIEIQIPSNSTATFNIPKGIINYRLNGHKYKNGPGTVELESGRHIFRSY
jgi:alpha-L-rhamnosidase